MLKLVVLSSLLVLAQASTTTITTTITTSANGETTVTTSTTSDTPTTADAGLTDKEIALVRETFPLIKSNSEIHARILLDHFKYHPETQKLFPKFANVPLADLPTNADFKNQAFGCAVFGLNFIVNNLDNPKLLAAQLQRVESLNKWYVNYMDEDRQLGETVRIFTNVIGEVLGPKLSPEAKAAWSKALTFAFGFMGTAKAAPASGKSVLSAAELAAARSAFGLIKGNVKVFEKAFIRLVTLHPPVQKLVPALADVPLSELENHDAFHAINHVSMRVASYLVDNLDNDELLSAILAKITVSDYFVDYMDPIHQLDETTRVFLEAAKEVLGSALTADGEAALQKGFDHIHDLMAAVATTAVNGAALDTTVKRPAAGLGLPAKTQQIIREAWSFARLNADIAPKLFLKMFEAHPEVQKMFPRFANVPFNELRGNKFFQQQVYNYAFCLHVCIVHMDTPDILEALLKKVSTPSFFVDGPSVEAQLVETTRIFNLVMAEELGAVYTAEVKQAFTDLLDYVHDIMAKAIEEVAPTAQDKQIIQDGLNALKLQKSNYGAKAILKMIKAHPESLKLFPKFANVPISDLATNAEFLAYGNVFSAGLNFMINNIDDPTVIKHMLASKNASQYFVPGVSIRQQLEETFRVTIEAIADELGPRFTSRTRDAFTRGLRFLNRVQDEAFEL